MSSSNLLAVYAHLTGWTFMGWCLGRLLPRQAPVYLGQFLFWVGVPFTIVTFLHKANLSVSLWLAPITAWVAILLGIGVAWGVIWWKTGQQQSLDRKIFWKRSTQGSFLLTSMLGNTGYIGYPVSLALVGSEYFSWAILYDLGMTFGAYGLGVALAAHFGVSPGSGSSRLQPAIAAMVQNPVFWSMGIGLACRKLAIPTSWEASLQGVALATVSLALVLMGMRLSRLSSLKSVQLAIASLGIKMMLVPLLLGTGLWLLGVRGLMHRVILLQMAMPPAFATLVLAEAYHLDHDLTVTAQAIGNLWLLVMLPLWLWIFGGLPN